MDPSQFLPSFGNAAFTIAAFVVALSIIVAIHEYGHYIVGRWSGIHPEVFSLGFGPVLWSRVDKRGTRWQVAALPFGGYVKFLGDANAASVGSADAVPDIDRRRTMLGAPLWARSATVAAGPIFNFILSLLIFAAVLFAQGQPADPARVAALEPLPDVMAPGLEPGDEIIAIEGQPVETIEEFYAAMGALTPMPEIGYTVRRGGDVVDITGHWPYPPIALGLNPASAAYDVDMRPGDVVLAVDGEPIYAFGQLVEKVTESNGQPLLLDVWRDGETLEFSVTPRRMDLPLAEGGFETRWLIGITGGVHFDLETERPGVFEALSMAAQQVWFIITSSLSGLGHMITGAISTCNLSGPVGIAQTSGAMASQGGQSFIWFVAVLSTAVGLLNLFPVPVLDGGHLVFHAYEGITGKPPSDAALRILMSIGLALIGTLMIFAIANDLWLCP
ncbi:RIP metalloprotease RseP [Ponticoccus sp. SC2-23]|uniref:RIP metalloprotease RseP n=1 Tax=Alexandriicola marinus TaxID=2081710 RepID=UPI000FD9879A|nr:RIP metalloprotease RseP [Alexandriicola marinus]MBM1218918.1 RIP metalloprotease RseP [Ponticoccus sp. SC6-9]MBM1224010.1 RIP metalloprotease RseP [Ponticoccus sp. SC6-15]MBM1230211.1 RIP metalloprotease RseP [Ponticoccus sp. SC6-38]MBM1232976.1 RIP metalloprotease RseP [Ponticoccus sp. SC6-45]MBM1237074.1 RIP metalloprotease RseP [Ponticoccus sp. SC6-49]MBM1241987.1 RIP metalloprotease RseP [Ponticoccus sp. SC2-64]MBM1246500.1 RIP metalloprotease RseP [Ponticoccus sp. SC6-42]MBM1250978